MRRCLMARIPIRVDDQTDWEDLPLQNDHTADLLQVRINGNRVELRARDMQFAPGATTFATLASKHRPPTTYPTFITDRLGTRMTALTAYGNGALQLRGYDNVGLWDYLYASWPLG